MNQVSTIGKEKREGEGKVNNEVTGAVENGIKEILLSFQDILDGIVEEDFTRRKTQLEAKLKEGGFLTEDQIEFLDSNSTTQGLHLLININLREEGINFLSNLGLLNEKDIKEIREMKKITEALSKIYQIWHKYEEQETKRLKQEIKVKLSTLTPEQKETLKKGGYDI